MIKHRLDAVLLSLLLTAFLAVQWTPAHAHLPTPHDHRGERHQHSVLAHVHQSAAVHPDAIDVGHAQLNEAPAVNLDHDLLASRCVHPDPHSTALVCGLRCPARVELVSFVLPEGRNVLPDLLPPHIGQARAPPPLV